MSDEQYRQDYAKRSAAAAGEILRLLADGKARLERAETPTRETWTLIAFPDRDFVFHYITEPGSPREPIGRGYMACGSRTATKEYLARDGAVLDIFGSMAMDCLVVLAELPRLGVELLRESDLHSTPPAQEAEEPPGTSSLAPRD